MNTQFCQIVYNLSDPHTHTQKEVRATDDHVLLIWANLTTVGVMPAAKREFFLTAVSNLLAGYKRNSLALFIHGNRASDTGRTMV